MEKNNSKQIILSVLAVIVLVIAVVGVSFAMYTFSRAGTQYAQISTASISLAYDTTNSSVITMTSQYPSDDARGFALVNNTHTFTVTPTNASTTTLDYTLHFQTVGTVDSLGPTHINFAEVDANGKALAGYGTCDNTANVAEADCNGTFVVVGKTVGDYMSATDEFAVGTIQSQAVTHRIKFWVNTSYDLAVDPNYQANDETKATVEKTYSFKVILTATA